MLGNRQSGGGPSDFGLGGAGCRLEASIRISFEEESIRGFSTIDFERRWREAVGKLPGVVNVTSAPTGANFGAPVMVQFSHADTEQRAPRIVCGRSLRAFKGLRILRTGARAANSRWT